MDFYVNPLPVVGYPFGHGGDSDRQYGGDYRSLADPEVIAVGERWYLYPTGRLAYVSDDMVHWTPQEVSPPDVGPAPTAAFFRGKYYLSGGDGPLYVSASPLGPFRSLGAFRTPDGQALVVRDTMLFADEDDRLYLYWGLGPDGIYGAELDGEEPTQLKGAPVQLIPFCPEHKWERFGEYNQSLGVTYIEGAYMLKERGRYYLVYSAPGTCFGSYCLAAYVSDSGPLAGFRCQTRNPILLGRLGLIHGCGHGSFCRDRQGRLWCYYTIAVCYEAKYERRIAMDPAFIDENGELYVDGPSSLPRLAPLGMGAAPAWLPLTFSCPVTVSSRADGRDGQYAVDESMLTWWEPAAADEAPWLLVELRAWYLVRAVRVILRDLGLSEERGVWPEPFCWRVVGRSAAGWTALCARDQPADLLCDAQSCEPAVVDAVRISWPKEKPGSARKGLISFTAFGVFEHS